VNWDRIENNWLHFRGPIQRQWSRLTDAQLEAIGGRREQLADQIQAVYGITRKEAGKQLYDWQKVLVEPPASTA
jgi:uncharacterized protein YjbJ (UPF0337 family)